MPYADETPLAEARRRDIVLFLTPPLTVGVLAGALGVGALAASGLALLWALAAASTDADRRLMILPDAVTVLTAALGLAAAVWASRDLGAAPLDAGLGGALGLISFFVVRAGYKAWRGREGLGLGDVKYAGAAGLWTGASGFGLYLMTACALAVAAAGLIAARHRQAPDASAPLPFGPALAGALAVFALARVWART